MKRPCLHCRKGAARPRERGLCRRCYRDRDVRGRYPAARQQQAWTGAQIALIRQHYGRLPIAELAALVGRSPGHVYARATNLGLRKPHHRIDRETVRELWDEGLSDREIAALEGWSYAGVFKVRARLVLPAKAHCRECHQARERAATCADWPGCDATLGEAKVLVALARLGQATGAEVYAACGSPTAGQHEFAALRRRGLVAPARREGRRVWWALAGAAAEAARRREQMEDLE